MSDYDDLSPWRDDPLVRALQAPGTPEELAGQAQYVARFRAAHPARSRRRTLRLVAGRLGTGGTAFAVTVALSSGVAAAAYTRTLPDPVQQIVHSVLGPVGAPAPLADGPGPRGSGAGAAPAPSTASPGAPVSPTPGTTPTPSPTPSAPASVGASPTAGASPGTTDQQPTATASPTAAPTSSPTTAPTTSPTAAPTTGPTTGPTLAPTTGPSLAPTNAPTEAPTTEATTSPTTSPTQPPPSTPAALSITGSTHRAGPGGEVVLSGIVTTADGSGVPGHQVVLDVYGSQGWRPVAGATTDDAGAVSVTTPPLTRSSAFRLHTLDGVSSPVWRVGLLPTLTTSTVPDGAEMDVQTTVQGAPAGDGLQLLEVIDGHTVPVARDVLGADGSATFPVTPPDTHPATYVVRLPGTPLHTAAAGRVTVAPLVPASVTATAGQPRVGVGGSTTLTGVVRAADGTPLAGRTVALVVRRPDDASWTRAGVATTDADGSVSIAGPAMTQTLRFRLRAGPVASSPVVVRMVPALTVSTTPDAPYVDIDAHAQGGEPGDAVLLQRRVDGQVQTLLQGTLAADGSVRFSVTPQLTTVTYLVRLVATRHHAAAVARVPVAPTS